MKVCGFCGLQSAGKNYWLISQKLHFPRPNSSLTKKKICCAKSQRIYFQSVLTDRVRQPSDTLRVAPFYWMCGRVAYLCVAFPHHIAKVCEMFVNFERIFLCKPDNVALVFTSMRLCNIMFKEFIVSNHPFLVRNGRCNS